MRLKEVSVNKSEEEFCKSLGDDIHSSSMKLILNAFPVKVMIFCMKD